MGQQFGQLCEFRDKQGRHRRVGMYRPNLARCFHPDDAPLATPTRCGAKFGTTEATNENDIGVLDFRPALERAWHLILALQIDRALTVLEAIEWQLDDLSRPVATRYRAATKLLRLAIVAFQDDNLAVLAIMIEPTDRRPRAFTTSACNGGAQPGSSVGAAITARERDVLSMIGQGCSNKCIARKLDISPETVKSHVKNIFSKLDVSTRTEAVSRALSLRLL